MQCLTKRLDIKRNGKVSVTDIEKIVYFPYSKEPDSNKSNQFYNEVKETVFTIPKENKDVAEEEMTFNRYKYNSNDSPQKKQKHERQMKSHFNDEDDNRSNEVQQYLDNDDENEIHLSNKSLYQVGKNKLERPQYDRTGETFASSYEKPKDYKSKSAYSCLNQLEQRRYVPCDQGDRENVEQREERRRNKPSEYSANTSNNYNYNRYTYQPIKRINEEVYQSNPMPETKHENDYCYQMNNLHKQNENNQYYTKTYEKPYQESNDDENKQHYQQAKEYHQNKTPKDKEQYEPKQYSERIPKEQYKPKRINQQNSQHDKYMSHEKVLPQKAYLNRNQNANSPIRVSNTLSLRVSPERKYINQDNQDEDNYRRNYKQNYNMNQQETDPNVFKEDQVILFLRTIMETETEIEKTKIDLAAQTDFNVDDTYNLFERDNKDMLNELDIKFGFNLFLLYPTKEELHLLLSKYDLMKQGGINYSDFFDMLTPFDKNIRDMIENRIPKGIPSSGNNTDIFSSSTKTFLITLLRLLISSENRIESLRKRFGEQKDITLKKVFSQMNQSNNQFIIVTDLEKYLKENGVVFNQKQVDLLYIRLDRNRDGRISYEELENEFTDAVLY